MAEKQANGAQVEIEPGPDAVARAAAERFASLAEEANREGSPFRVALSGGSTPKLLYRLLSGDDYRARVPWGNIEFFFGDERWVPATDKDSNYNLARTELFDKVGIGPGAVFPVPTEGITPQEAAERYEQTIRSVFGDEDGRVPRFDLIFLGMGDDGHTASCFPFTEAIHEDRKLVTANFVPKLSTWRITLCPPVLRDARQVIFLVTGAGKAPALKEVLQGPYNPDMYPSQLLRDAEGQVTWLVDQAAAAQLSPA